MENDKNGLFKKILLSDKQRKDEIVLKRWEEIGFLTDLKDDAKLITAHAFELAAEAIIFNVVKVKKDIEIMLFPAIRIILSNNDNYLNYTVDNIYKFIHSLLGELIKSYDNDFEVIKKKCDNQNITDYQAEFLYSFIDEYLKKHSEEI